MKGLLLISGGIDSPVAGYLMVKNKVDVIAVHFNNNKDKTSLKKVENLAKKVGVKKLYIVNLRKSQEEISKSINRRFQCLLCKRMMLRVAEKIAKKEKCDFLVTGENLGQVASQTLANMVVTNNAVKISILRPLLCYDKVQTIALARKIETYDISIQKDTPCAFVPINPATKSNVELIEREEEKVDIKKLIEDSLEGCEVIDL